MKQANITEIILYTTSDGKIKIDTILRDNTIWLNKEKMGGLFGVQRPAITNHLKNIFEREEWDKQVVSSILEHTTTHGAITGKPTAELIKSRNDSEAPKMGLTVWQGSIVRKQHIAIAKIYLNAEEINQLNQIDTMYLDYAELQTKQRKSVTMAQWSDKLDAFWSFDEQKLLNHAGKVKAEALTADDVDVKELEDLEKQLLQQKVKNNKHSRIRNGKVETIVSKTGCGCVIEHIKVSRGEENIFIWCFFLAVAQLAIDRDGVYDWVKYIYIDDPISSLDDNNAIALASHLSRLLKNQSDIKAVISTHHTLFFNVMYNELKKAEKYFLGKNKNGEYTIRNTSSTPFFHHVALLKELHEVAESGNIYTYHFNILRNILEKTASFHGFKDFSSCIKQDSDDLDGTIHTRLVNLLSHGNYSLFEPKEMLDDNKEYFKKILKDFMANYRFNPELFPEEART